MLRFVKKRILKDTKPFYQMAVTAEKTEPVENTEAKPVDTEAKPKIKKEKKKVDMITMEQVAAAEQAVEEMKPEVKVVKKDRGLIERTESSKIILTEDNRQVLND